MFQPGPHIETAADTHPQTRLSDLLPLRPDLLARDTQGDQDQIRCLTGQCSLHLRPGVLRLVSVDCHHEVQARKGLRKRPAQNAHHFWRCSDKRNAPTVGRRIPQKGPGQFNSRRFHDLHALAGQGPHHPSTIGNHQIRGGNGPTQLRVASGSHGHLRIQRHDTSTTTGVQSDGG